MLRGLIAFSGIAGPLPATSSGGEHDDDKGSFFFFSSLLTTPARKVARLACSCVLEVLVTRGMQRKCVSRGGGAAGLGGMA